MDQGSSPKPKAGLAEFDVVPPGPIHGSKKMMLAKFLQVDEGHACEGSPLQRGVHFLLCAVCVARPRSHHIACAIHSSE